jgi:sulfite reductase alpha subunit-like flavoprotein
VPKKALLRALGDAATDQRDQDALFYLAGRSAGAVKVFANFVEAQRLDLRDLLALFPSSRPQLATLLSVLSPMQPRFYSLASSPLVDPCTMRIAFNVVGYEARPAGAARGPQRYGLATTWLEAVATAAQEAMAAAIAKGAAPPPVPLLRAFLRPAKAFVPPPALSTPLVMVGPGTGLSPFIGFIEHRAARRDAAVRAAAAATTGFWRGGAVLSGLSDVSDTSSNPSTALGEAILIYGNRAPSVDWLFRSEVESAVASGSLREAVAAWSRASDTPRELVTDVVGGKAAHAETQKALAALILRDKAHFFVCGGSAMAADVRTALARTLAQYSPVFNAGIDTPLSAEAYVAEMLKSGRYAEDKWG